MVQTCSFSLSFFSWPLFENGLFFLPNLGAYANKNTACPRLHLKNPRLLDPFFCCDRAKKTTAAANKKGKPPNRTRNLSTRQVLPANVHLFAHFFSFVHTIEGIKLLALLKRSSILLVGSLRKNNMTQQRAIAQMYIKENIGCIANKKNLEHILYIYLILY